MVTAAQTGTHRPSWRLATLAILLVGVSLQAVEAQDGTSVDVGTATGVPGATVYVPISVTAPESLGITRIEQDLRFDSRLLSFVRAEVAEGVAGLEVTALVETDREDPDRAIVRLTTVVTAALGPGTLMTVVFRINEGAPPATKVILESEARVGRGEGDLSATSSTDGEVEVTNELIIFGCFFYMH